MIAATRTFLCILAVILAAHTANGKANAQGIRDKKNISLSVSKGQKILIQNMYAVNTKTCVGDSNPPKPIFFGELKFGSVNYRQATIKPQQCQNIIINANIAEYTASDNSGTDKFKIHWKSEKGTIFIRNYTIEVK